VVLSNWTMSRHQHALRRLRTHYRASSILVIVVFAASLMVPAPWHVSQGGDFTPCLLDEQLPENVRLGLLVLFVGFLVCTFRGLWNRPVPRWLGIVGIVGLPIALYQKQQHHRPCEPHFSVGETILWAAMMLMYLHHAVQPGRGRRDSGDGATEFRSPRPTA
jgi:hypothetical protein